MAKTKPGFYAVRKGRKTGVFTSWDEVKPLIDRFPGAQHKKFETRAQAELWSSTPYSVSPQGAPSSSAPSSSQSPRLERSPRRPTPSSSPTKPRPTSSPTKKRMAETRPSPPSSPTKKPKTNGITVKQENSIVQAPPEEKDPEWSPTRSEVEMALAMHALIQQDPWIEVEVEGRVERMQTVYEIYFGEDNSQNQVRPVLIDGQETDEEKETRAVLVGVYEMCKLIHARNDGLKYDIRTTSQFAIDCYYKHCFKWKINGWTNTNDNPVPNKDVIEATMELLQQLQGRIKFGKLKVVG